MHTRRLVFPITSGKPFWFDDFAELSSSLIQRPIMIDRILIHLVLPLYLRALVRIGIEWPANRWRAKRLPEISLMRIEIDRKVAITDVYLDRDTSSTLVAKVSRWNIRIPQGHNVTVAIKSGRGNLIAVRVACIGTDLMENP